MYIYESLFFRQPLQLTVRVDSHWCLCCVSMSIVTFIYSTKNNINNNKNIEIIMEERWWGQLWVVYNVLKESLFNVPEELNCYNPRFLHVLQTRHAITCVAVFKLLCFSLLLHSLSFIIFFYLIPPHQCLYFY